MNSVINGVAASTLRGSSTSHCRGRPRRGLRESLEAGRPPPQVPGSAQAESRCAHWRAFSARRPPSLFIVPPKKIPEETAPKKSSSPASASKIQRQGVPPKSAKYTRKRGGFHRFDRASRDENANLVDDSGKGFAGQSIASPQARWTFRSIRLWAVAWVLPILSLRSRQKGLMNAAPLARAGGLSSVEARQENAVTYRGDWLPAAFRVAWCD